MSNLFRTKSFILFIALIFSLPLLSQNADTGRAITQAEYEKAKTFSVKDLDKDTYIKFDNAYILDRYEAKKPYFITGDDGLKKRIDLYKLIAKQGMQTLGTMIFYTNETGKMYKAVLPGLTADPKIWEQYFEDIHAIDKDEKNFVLKLSYVLSKELSFQIYKAEGKPVSKESATYGNDICFTGDNEVELADGTSKLLKNITAGDKVKTYDALTDRESVVTIQSLTIHKPKNYAVTELLLTNVSDVENQYRHDVVIINRVLKATPNHPVKTSSGLTSVGKVKLGDRIICYNEKKKAFEQFTVWNKREFTEGVQPVYNMVANDGETFILNSVVVLQKQQEN